MKKKERTRAALLRQDVDRIPVFMSATPQFLERATSSLPVRGNEATAARAYNYCRHLDLDVVQVGHPSFYPVRVMELSEGSTYKDDFGRTHVICGYYDEFRSPFPLRDTKRVNVDEVRHKWENYEFPDPMDEKWFQGVNTVVSLNDENDDPLAVWGVINGPFEPTWQLLSDGWPEFFILARLDEKLAFDIISRVTDYCIDAGHGMIEHGVDAIRIGDDYALNTGLMVSKERWMRLVYPFHRKLVTGLKRAAKDNEFPVILHSDGNIMEIIDELAKPGGIDALNPIQPDALDFQEVLEAAGNKLALTGAFDLRHFMKPLDENSARRIRQEVRRLIDAFDEFNFAGGQAGFCIGPTHQVQPASYVETFEFWVEVVHEKNVQRAARGRAARDP